MEAIRQVQKRYCSKAITAAIVAGFFLILAGRSTVAKGLVLGTLFSIVNFILMGEMLPLGLGKSPRKTFFLSLGSMLFRYLLLAVPIVLAVKVDQFNLIAAVCGIFMVQGVILVETALNMLASLGSKQT